MLCAHARAPQGGFSTYVNRPAWQATPVNDYLTNGPNVPPRSMFSSLGRAYPDVAMIGHNFPVWIAGQEYIESGTSASAPVVASMFALINGVRLAGGARCFFVGRVPVLVRSRLLFRARATNRQAPAGLHHSPLLHAGPAAQRHVP